MALQRRQRQNMKKDKRSLTMTEIMSPDSANFSGYVHGGKILSLLDNVAYACASRYSEKYVVTLSVDHVIFKKPINVGDLVHFYASVNYVGKTSMEVGIKVVAEKITTGEEQHTNTCYFTMVAVDENHKPTSVPPLTLRTDEEKRRSQQAQIRKQFNKSYQEQTKKLKNNAY